MTQSPDDLTALSRSGTSSIFGKRTQGAKTKLAPITKEGLGRIWRELGYQTEGEFIAHLIEIRVHGLEHVTNVAQARLAAVAGNGPTKGS